MKFKAVIILLILLSPIAAVFGEDSVVLGQINTEIDGKTRRFALLKELRIYEGKEFDSLESLEYLLKSRTNDLLRRRLFKEFTLNIDIENPMDIKINIYIVDSFTLMPRPKINYSSDRGLTLGMKIDYFNAFGTLTDQKLEGYWSPNEILFEVKVEKIILGPVHLDTSFRQFNGTTRYGDTSGNIPIAYRNNSSELSASLDVPLSPGSPWSYVFSPLVSWLYDYELGNNDTPFPDNEFINPGFAPGLNHGFESDQINWVGNFRKGFYFDFKNNNLWYTETGRTDSFLESDLKAYLPLSSWFELSGRIGGFYAFSGQRKNAGDRLRGVVDYMTWGEWGDFISIQANFRLFQAGNLFSMHLRPFVDIGYVYSELWGAGPQAWEYCVGATAILYFNALPSLNLNIDWGWDFKRNMPELIIGTEHLL